MEKQEQVVTEETQYPRYFIYDEVDHDLFSKKLLILFILAEGLAFFLQCAV